MKKITICAYCGSRDIRKNVGGLCFCYNCRRERHTINHFVDSNIFDKIRTKIYKITDRLYGL